MHEIAHPTDAWRLTYVRIELNIISHRKAFRSVNIYILMARFGIYDFVAAMRHVSRANYVFSPHRFIQPSPLNAPCCHFRMKFLSAMPTPSVACNQLLRMKNESFF